MIRFGDEGREEPGILLVDGRRMDASSEFHDYDENFFTAGGMEALAGWVAAGCPGGREVDPAVRLGPPVKRPSSQGTGRRHSHRADALHESDQLVERTPR
jgi:hypothetical protein